MTVLAVPSDILVIPTWAIAAVLTVLNSKMAVASKALGLAGTGIIVVIITLVIVVMAVAAHLEGLRLAAISKIRYSSVKWFHKDN
jgi:hypothetical protein